MIVSFAAGRLLERSEGELLLRNVPAAIALERRGGCIWTELHAAGDDLFEGQVRNGCPRSGYWYNADKTPKCIGATTTADAAKGQLPL